MELFLVSGEVRTTLYGSTKTSSSHETRLVEATNWQDAVDKFIREFESQSSEYVVSCNAYGIVR